MSCFIVLFSCVVYLFGVQSKGQFTSSLQCEYQSAHRHSFQLGYSLTGTLKSQSELPLAYTVYNNTVIGTLAVDGSVVTFGTASRGLGGLRLPLAATLPTSYNGIITIAGYKGLSNRY